MRVVVLVSFLCLLSYAQAPNLFLLKTYKDDLNVTGWIMSEKLDGVRAFWDGQKLISRSGKIFTPPTSFIRGFPPFALDGELWSKRDDFEHIVSIVNTQDSSQGWDELTYNVFELPEQEGGFFERLAVLEDYLSDHKADKLRVLKQTRIHDRGELKRYFDRLIGLGAEGVVVRDPHQKYYTGRRRSSVKYKSFFDDECRLLSITEGKGKFSGQMGVMECDYWGKLIKIGSGFTNEQRMHPPKIGSVISFKYYGLTKLGNPKYPVFLRVRSDAKISLTLGDEEGD